MQEFLRTLRAVEDAYRRVQDGELGRTVLVSEGASSFAIETGRRPGVGHVAGGHAKAGSTPAAPTRD